MGGGAECSLAISTNLFSKWEIWKREITSFNSSCHFVRGYRLLHKIPMLTMKYGKGGLLVVCCLWHLPALMFVHSETYDFLVFSYILSFLVMQVIYRAIRTVVADLLRPLISLSYCSWLAYSTVKSKIIKSSDQHLTIWLLYCTFWFKSINDFAFYSCQKTTHLL